MAGTQPPNASAIACSVWFGPVVSPAEERKLIDYLVTEHGVGVCCWPRDVARVEHLEAAHVPRLLLVGPDSVPPASAPGQAWVRTTAGNDEVHAAFVGLCRPRDLEVRRSV